MNFKFFTDFFKKIKNKNNNFMNYIILALVGVLLLIGSSFFKTATASSNNLSSSDKVSNDNQVNEGMSEQELEDKLKRVLTQTEGVGRVEVMIYFESGEEQVPAVNINDSTSITQEKDNVGGTRSTTQQSKGSSIVITGNGEKNEPLIVKKYKPRISGVYIVAEGAENKVTELRITQAVQRLFSITAEKVSVYPMKK